MPEPSYEQILRFKRGKQQKILIYRFGQLGDTIIALPALWALRRAFSEANLTYLRSDHPGRGHVPAQDILPREGLMDDWLHYTRRGRGGYRDLFQLWKVLRARRFDLLVYLVPRLRPAFSIWRDLFYFRSAGIPYVIGHKGFPDPLPRIAGQPLPSVEHEADHLLHRLELSQVPILPQQRGNMNLALTPEEKQKAEDWLLANVPGYPSGASLIGIGPGSKMPSKIWPAERFAELVSRLISDLSVFPIVFGGPGDIPLAKQLIRQWDRGACAAGSLAVRPAAAALANCRLYVGNDTGTMHLAAAVGTRCVGIFAAQDWPGRWAPYGQGHIVLRQQVPCEGCELKECIKEGMRCLKEITVEDAWQACYSVLRGKSSY